MQSMICLSDTFCFRNGSTIVSLEAYFDANDTEVTQQVTDLLKVTLATDDENTLEHPDGLLTCSDGDDCLALPLVAGSSIKAALVDSNGIHTIDC